MTKYQAAVDSNAEMFQRLGAITRQLHNALNELGYTPVLKGAVD